MFYPNDWLSSPDLNSCSLEAQGLWIKMLCIMYQSPERGVLLLSSGKAIDSKTLAKICGVDEQAISKLLTELEDTGVLSRLDNQSIYNRRMYREGEISRVRSEVGRLGGLRKDESKTKAKVKQNAEYEYEYEDIVSSPINLTTVDKLPEKEKPTKEKFLEFVLLTPEEHKKLIEKLGENKTKEMIERLNNYIGSKGKQYKSHYHTILAWLSKDEKEGQTDGRKDNTGKYADVPVLKAEDLQ